MSRYILKEHLMIEDTGKSGDAVSLLNKRLMAFSMSLMPRGNVQRCEIALRAGKDLHAFAGKLPTPDYYGIVDAISQAETLEFIAFYEYEWEDFWEQSRNGDPFLMISLMQRLPVSKELFYSMYTADDQEPGECMAYGEKNGRKYQGVIPYVEVPGFPDRGRWCAPVIAVDYTAQEVRNLDTHSLLQVCRDLCSLGGKSELQLSQHGFHFLLRNLTMVNKEQLERYYDLIAVLLKLTQNRCLVCEELADLTAADPELLTCAGGKVKMSIL